jgi:hypothetical protein
MPAESGRYGAAFPDSRKYIGVRTSGGESGPAGAVHAPVRSVSSLRLAPVGDPRQPVITDESGVR